MDLVTALLETFAPTRCAGCDMPGTLLCDECAAQLAVIDPEYACRACGAPYGWLTCTECWNSEPAFAAARTLALLEPPLSRCLVVYKDSGERRLVHVLGDMLAGLAGDWLGWAEAVTAVPATRAAVRRRGYDHAALMASRVSDVTGLNLGDFLRPGETRDQRRLGRLERRANTADAFSCLPGVKLPRYVLLLDDVMTTGATVDAAASALLAGGASEVRVCALARSW